MKNNQLRSLFVRGGMLAMLTLTAAPAFAFDGENNIYENTPNGTLGLLALAMAIGMLSAPAIAEKMKHGRKNKQK